MPGERGNRPTLVQSGEWASVPDTKGWNDPSGPTDDEGKKAKTLNRVQ